MSSVLIALRRLREDRAPAIGLGLLILVTATLFGLAPRLTDRVGDDALHGVVSATTAFNRDITLLEEQVFPTGRAAPLDNIDREGDRLDAKIPTSIRALIHQRQTVVDSARFEIQTDTPDPSFVRFRIQPGAAARIRYTTGVAPSATAQRVQMPEELRRFLPAEEPPSTDPVNVTVLETAISVEAADAIEKTVGDLLFLSFDRRDPLAQASPGVVATRISGLYEVNDPADPFWSEDQSLNHVGIRSIGGDSRFIDVGALLPAESYDALIRAGQLFGTPIRTTWRHFIDPQLLASARIDGLIVDLRRLETAYPQTQVTNGTLAGAAMRSGLLPLLVAHQARWVSASAVLTVVAIGPAAVAFAALGLVATIAARRRRPALALVRGRGATLGQIVRAVFLEGCVIAIPAVGSAILVALLLIPVGGPRATILAASAVGTVAVALLIATAMPGTTAAARGAREDDASPRGVSIRRLVLDLVVILLAAGGAYLLRERGVRGASSTGALGGADPLIAAVPALAGIAAGLAAIRLVSLPLRVLGRIAARGRGLVPLLALRRAVHGGTTAAVLVVLLATASIGAFSSAALVHLERASSAAAWHEIGAPIRVTSHVGALPVGFDASSLPGVRSSATLFKVLTPVGVRNLRITLIVVDLSAWAPMVAGTPADPAIPPEMLTPTAPGAIVPLIVSTSLAERTDGVPLDKPFEVVVEGYHYQVKPVTTRDTFPTLAADATFAVASRQQLLAVHPEAQLAPITAFLDAPDGDANLAAIRTAATSLATTATVESRAAFARAFTDSPVTAAIVAGIAVAALIAAAYAALAVTAALALAGASRATEVAHLRMIGLSRSDALGLAVIEHGPTVLLAFVAGVALGLGLFVLLEPGLGLDAIVGSRIAVPLSADPRQLALIAAGVIAIAVVGIGLAAWMQRRGVAVAALRRGFEQGA
ncbi:MAG: ABC transporter permease [Candidatus Limnocylindrales bacterium]